MIIRKEELAKYDLGMELQELHNMELGASYKIKDTLNKIKRVTKEEWMFQRFDSIVTHLVELNSTSDNTQAVWQGFVNVRDYSMKYAQDRCNMINSAFAEEDAVTVVSSTKFINEQVKSTSKELSGENGFTKTIDKIVDFIVYAKFNNEAEELEYEEKKKEAQRIELIKKKKRKEREEERLAKLKEEIKDTPSSKTRKLKQPPHHYQVTSIERVIEEDGGLTRSGASNINYTRVDRQMQQGKFDESMEKFWDRYSPSKSNHVPHYHNEPINYKDMAYSTMKQYIKEIESLEALSFTPERAKQVSWVKGEMRTALEILRKVITVQPTINIDETIPNDSWDRLSLRNTDTYIALLNGYNEASKKYNSKPSTNFWAILRDFESLLQKTEWTKEEAIIIEFILETGLTDHKSIQEELIDTLDYDIPQTTLNYWLNNIIPNKLHDTYEKQIENWVWTYRRKGSYKTCKSCGSPKLAVDTRYFNKEKNGVLGLKSKCKQCLQR